MVRCVERAAGKCNSAPIVGGVLGAADKVHVLTDAEKGDVEGWDKDNVMEVYLGTRGNHHFHAANAFDGTLGGTIAKCDILFHLFVSATYDN